MTATRPAEARTTFTVGFALSSQPRRARKLGGRYPRLHAKERFVFLAHSEGGSKRSLTTQSGSCPNHGEWQPSLANVECECGRYGLRSYLGACELFQESPPSRKDSFPGCRKKIAYGGLEPNACISRRRLSLIFFFRPPRRYSGPIQNFGPTADAYHHPWRGNEKRTSCARCSRGKFRSAGLPLSASERSGVPEYFPAQSFASTRARKTASSFSREPGLETVHVATASPHPLQTQLSSSVIDGDLRAPYGQPLPSVRSMRIQFTALFRK